MAAQAFVDGTFACPHCSHPHDRIVAISWGLCATGGFTNGLVYRAGDRVEWRADHDRKPQANVCFGGPDQLTNVGDPAQRNVVLLDAQGIPGQPSICSACEHTFVVVVEIEDGVVARLVGCQPDDERVAAAVEVGRTTASAPVEQVTWNHGVGDDQLSEVFTFLDRFDFSQPVPIVGRPMTFEEKRAEAEVLRRRQLSINEALLTGADELPRHLLCHGLGRRTGEDPFLLDRRLSELQHYRR